MAPSMMVLLLGFTVAVQISGETLSGIYVIDACECTSPTEKCEPNGPFIIDQQRTSFAVRYGTVQVGVGTTGNNRLDLFLNQNRCKGLWNGRTRMAELKCQHQGGVVCATRLRCVSGSCQEDRSALSVSSARMTSAISVVSLICSVLMVIF